jgi:tRNA (guanine37-N1)-methyltransferase
VAPASIDDVRIDVVTIFPAYLAPLREALLGRAIERGLVDLAVHDLRSWTHDVHQAVDDAPYGGGPGMVMRPQVWGEALDAVVAADPRPPRLVVPTPAGRPFTQLTARAWAGEQRLLFACGRYEGIDQRVVDDAAGRMPVDEVSIGDYVLVGGEAAVLVIVEAVVRLLPGVLGNPVSATQDSFSDGLLEGPCYTRPERWRGRDVPAVLRSGNHAAIARWRRDQALERTAARRPELLAALPPAAFDAADRALLAALRGRPGTEPAAPAGPPPPRDRRGLVSPGPAPSGTMDGLPEPDGHRARPAPTPFRGAAPPHDCDQTRTDPR